jgi:hypothetical protein
MRRKVRKERVLQHIRKDADHQHRFRLRPARWPLAGRPGRMQRLDRITRVTFSSSCFQTSILCNDRNPGAQKSFGVNLFCSICCDTGGGCGARMKVFLGNRGFEGRSKFVLIAGA